MPRQGWRSAQADIVYGIAILAAGAAMLAHTFSEIYDTGPLFGDVSTVFVPRILLIAICILAASLVVKGALARDSESLDAMNWQRIAFTFAAASATTAGVWYFGYQIAMPVGIFLTGLAIGYPNRLILAAASVAATATVWLTLGYLARVSLPEGQFF
jgi:hypothetical protein